MSVEAKPKRTRKSVEVEPAVQPVAELAPAAPEAPAEPLMLTPPELAQLKLLEANLRAARADMETSRIRKKYFLALLDPKGTVTEEEKRLEKLAEEARGHASQYETLKARISTRLKLDLNKCGFDPDTGLVVPGV